MIYIHEIASEQNGIIYLCVFVSKYLNIYKYKQYIGNCLCILSYMAQIITKQADAYGN